jgi:hypothetical protein
MPKTPPSKKSASRKTVPKRAAVAKPLKGETPAGGLPPYDPAAVGRVAGRVQISTIELVHAQFERADAAILPSSLPMEAIPEIGIHLEWELSADRSTFGCIANFGTIFPEDAPYELHTQFRLIYHVTDGGDLKRGELEQFAHWNAVFNAWPYWREYLSSTLNRAQLPRFMVPVMGVPRPPDPSNHS